MRERGEGEGERERERERERGEGRERERERERERGGGGVYLMPCWGDRVALFHTANSASCSCSPGGVGLIIKQLTVQVFRYSYQFWMRLFSFLQSIYFDDSLVALEGDTAMMDDMVLCSLWMELTWSSQVGRWINDFNNSALVTDSSCAIKLYRTYQKWNRGLGVQLLLRNVL